MSEDPIVALRADLDRWNVLLRGWEEKLQATQAELLPVYEGQLAEWRGQLERAAVRLRDAKATSAAGVECTRDVEAALAEVAEAFRRVRARHGSGTP